MNNFLVNFIIGDNQPITAGYLQVGAEAILPNGSRFVIGNEAFNANPNRTNWSFHKSLNLTLDQVAPELAALSSQLKTEVSTMVKDFDHLSPTVDKDIEDAKSVIKEIREKDFYALLPEDFAKLKVAQDRYNFLKSEVAKKKESIRETTAKLRAATQATRLKIENALVSEGLDIRATDVLDSAVTIEIEKFANLGNGPDLAEMGFPFQAWSQETLQDLSLLYDAGQTVNFLQKAEEFTRQSERLLDIVTVRSVVSREELNEYEKAQKLVNDYLYGSSEVTGKITTDYWIRSLNVPADVRNGIDKDLAELDEAKARELKAYLNGLKTLSDRIVNNLRVLSELTQAYKAAQDEAERKFLDRLMEGAIATIKNAPEIAKCLGENYVAGPYADFYEFYYERDFCTGEPNTEIDRWIAGTSLAIEAGSAILATPVGGWVASQLATPIKFVTKIGSAVRKATAAATSAKLDHIASVLSAGILTKTIKNSDEAKVVAKGAAYLTAEMENKILKGALNKNNKLIGGHSPSLLSDSDFQYASKTLNPDGTIALTDVKKKIDGVDYAKKFSILFPEHWTDNKILSEIRKVAGSKEVGRRARDNAFLHILVVDNVEIVLIREGDRITSAFPSGQVGYWVTGFDKI